VGAIDEKLYTTPEDALRTAEAIGVGERGQYLLDKWFWRSWQLFAVLTGFSMDYFTPLSSRSRSFKEFMQEWVIDQYLSSIESFGLKKPWYWNLFLDALDHYHHQVYASAYTYRASVWFDFVLPGREKVSWERIIDTADEAGFLAQPTTHPSGDELALDPRSMSVFKLSAGSQEHARATSWKLRPARKSPAP